MNFYFEIPKQLAGPIEHLWAYIEGVVQAAILLNRSHNRVLAFTEYNVVATERKVGCARSGKAPFILEPEDFTIKLFSLS